MALGSVFPYLLRTVEGSAEAPGTIIGRLNALNTAGAVVGSLTAGFLLLGAIGLWNSVRLFAAGYLLLGLVVSWWTSHATRRGRVALAISVASLVLVATLLDASRLPVVYASERRGERVLETWEGPDGIVAVVERRSGRRIKVNNFYALGGTASTEHEQNQALIPIMGHPRPDSVFFLGLGTGITAGAALRLPTQRVTVCELSVSSRVSSGSSPLIAIHISPSSPRRNAHSSRLA